MCGDIHYLLKLNWGEEARRTFILLAKRLAFGSSFHKARVIGEMYGRLSITLIARTILARNVDFN